MDIQGSFFSPWELDSQGYGANVKAYYLNITNPASEQMGYKALRMFQGQNNAGVKAREYLESLGYDGVNNSNEEYIAFDSNQIKLIDNTNPTENEDIRLSLSKSNEEQAPGRFMNEDIAYRDDSQSIQDNANDIAPVTTEFDDVTAGGLFFLLSVFTGLVHFLREFFSLLNTKCCWRCFRALPQISF